MTVLLVTGVLPPDHGRSASHVRAIALGLQGLGHSVESVITLSDRAESGDDSEYSFVIQRSRLRQPRWLGWHWTVGAISRSSARVDVVDLNGLMFKGIVATEVFGRKPTVVKVFGDLISKRARSQNATQLNVDDFQTSTMSLKWRFLRFFQGWYRANADRFITPSRYSAKVVAGSSEKVRVVYDAVAIPVPQEFPRADLRNRDRGEAGRVHCCDRLRGRQDTRNHRVRSRRVPGSGRRTVALFAAGSCPTNRRNHPARRGVKRAGWSTVSEQVLGGAGRCLLTTCCCRFQEPGLLGLGLSIRVERGAPSFASGAAVPEILKQFSSQCAGGTAMNLSGKVHLY